MSLLFALAGNQNSGKTTLFNQLTGSNQRVGNFPGVTVEKKEGIIKRHKDVTIVDLPGIYSLSPYSSEEIVARNFLVQDRPDAIINVIDATCLERNLYLTLQLIELRIPMIIALNMMDEVRANQGHINIEEMEKDLGVPVVPISATKNEGVDDLLRRAIETAVNKKEPKRLDFCSGQIHKAIHATAHLVEDQALENGFSARFAATKLIEGDPLLEKQLKLSEPDRKILQLIVSELESETGQDRETAIINMRYAYIDQLISQFVVKPKQSRELLRTLKIDTVLTHKVFGIPIFIGVMLFIFWLTFGPLGSWFSGIFEAGIDWTIGLVDNVLTYLNASTWIHSFIIEGVFAGVGSVLSFLPIILLLFFFLSILEDTGYMARIAFVLDHLLRRIGLSGRSCVPMLMGFGCSVPAIMATRTLPSERDRKMTIILTPFMSCGAKLPIYALFTAAFFKGHHALIMITLYLTGIIVAILSSILLSKTAFKGSSIPFVLELPSYRFPSLKNVLLNIWYKIKGFIQRAFTIILLATIIVWFLQSYDWSFFMTQNSENSILASIGSFIAPIFIPLGFGTWQASTALITGLMAKETVVSTFSVLLSGSGDAINLQAIFTPLSAFSFLCFTLLYMPCVAALAATRREMGSTKGALFAVGYQTGVAWIVAFIVFQVGRLVTMVF